MPTSLYRTAEPFIGAVVIICAVVYLVPTTTSVATTPEASDSATEPDDDNGTSDAEIVDQEEDLGNDPSPSQYLDLDTGRIDTGDFALTSTNDGLAELFTPITDSDHELEEFYPVAIDDGLLPDPPIWYEGSSLGEH